MGHGRALINIEDPQLQLEIYEKILANSLSVRETEKLVRNLQEGKPESKGCCSCYSTQHQEKHQRIF